MFEKVNPSHPDKIADRIAGSIVDLAYKIIANPKIAVEVLIGHNKCNIIIESNLAKHKKKINIQSLIEKNVHRICNNYDIEVNILFVDQDIHLANNQDKEIRCGDNGIFKGSPMTFEEKKLSIIVGMLYDKYPTDGKYIYNEKEDLIIACQSNASYNILEGLLAIHAKNLIINPLGSWTGGINVDSGATNRKLGSDMGNSVTGGGLHGKDLSKADVSVNIWCYLMAQKENKTFTAYCAIGDRNIKVYIDNEYAYDVSYDDMIKVAKEYIDSLGGFEKFAEYGLIR